MAPITRSARAGGEGRRHRYLAPMQSNGGTELGRPRIFLPAGRPRERGPSSESSVARDQSFEIPCSFCQLLPRSREAKPGARSDPAPRPQPKFFPLPCHVRPNGRLKPVPSEGERGLAPRTSLRQGSRSRLERMWNPPGFTVQTLTSPS